MSDVPTSDDAHSGNLLAGVAWECTSTPPGALAGPDELDDHSAWWPAAVPGTAAGALLDAGVARADLRDYDQDDWWFRCRFHAPEGTWVLGVGGVATVGDVWMDGAHLLATTNMFRSWAPRLALQGGDHELVIRCSALAPALAARRPRPRWKTYLVSHQNLRWFRTSLLGRIPGWAQVPATVGPWRAVTLTAAETAAPRHVHLAARCEGPGGVVDVSFRLDAAAWRAGEQAGAGEVRVGDVVAPLSVAVEGDEAMVSGQVRLPQVERWWPHTHGAQPLYAVTARLAGTDVALGRVGFRTVTLDRSDDGFQFSVNDEPLFCRGACWFPPDPVRPGGNADDVRRTLLLARDAHMNMVRVPGTSVYEDATFFDLCDELGILVWHDCMFAFMDPPDDDAFNEDVSAELTQAFAAMSGHPCVTVVCGGQEIEEVAAMNGLPPDRWSVALLEKTIPGVLEGALPDVPYVTSNPSGGDLPFRMDAGVCQYFGVGGYMRPIEDARLAKVRFAAECLAYSTPPEVSQVEEWGGAWAAGHDPAWKRGLHHDAGRSWDMEDVRDFYMRALFKVDPLEQRYVDAERALDLGRATNAALMEAVFSEWRHPGSSCAGGLVLGLRDLRPGAGWGVVDAAGIPKAPWYALRRVWAPVTVIVTDEGLNGLHCHVVNDTAEPFRGSLRISLYTRGELHTEEATCAVDVDARGSHTVRAENVLDGFRDVSYAYRFAPPAQDVVALALLDVDGTVVAETVYLPLGQARSVEADLGLSAEAVGGPEEGWVLHITTRRFAQWVVVEVPGYHAEDSWFHLPPQGSRLVALQPLDPLKTPDRPSGRVRALNSQVAARITVAS